MLFRSIRPSFRTGDEGLMRQQLEWSVGKPDAEATLLDVQSATEAFYGRRRRAREYSDRAVQSAKRSHLMGSAATYLLDSTSYEVEFGNVVKASGDVGSALAIASDLGNRSHGALLLAHRGLSMWLPTTAGCR